MQNRLNPSIPEVQQNQAVGRNPQSSSYQPDQFLEDEYRPHNNVAMNTNIDMPD
ncbi:hypothetical protein A2U01_0116095, partial [Trifolium medium]|nr:hypothetical protein [Trifolium medium]